jgi:hypothetical protein
MRTSGTWPGRLLSFLNKLTGSWAVDKNALFSDPKIRLQIHHLFNIVQADNSNQHREAVWSGGADLPGLTHVQHPSQHVTLSYQHQTPQCLDQPEAEVRHATN